MDDLDRMLRDLPDEPIPEALIGSVRAVVRRRHRRQLALRRAAAVLLGTLGVWLLWPAIAWISSGGLYAPGTPWLMGSLDSLGSESLDLLGRVWSGLLSMQGSVGSGLAVSILLGAVFTCCSIFLAVDRASWQPVSESSAGAGRPTMSPSGIHL